MSAALVALRALICIACGGLAFTMFLRGDQSVAWGGWAVAALYVFLYMLSELRAKP